MRLTSCLQPPSCSATGPAIACLAARDRQQELVAICRSKAMMTGQASSTSLLHTREHHSVVCLCRRIPGLRLYLLPSSAGMYERCLIVRLYGWTPSQYVVAEATLRLWLHGSHTRMLCQLCFSAMEMLWTWVRCYLSTGLSSS